MDPGNPPAVAFHVYGDESISAEIVAYGVVIVPHAKLGETEAAVVAAKERFGAPATGRIHCKTLLHGTPRANSPEWRHLSSDDSFALIRDVTASAEKAGARAWVGFVDSRTIPDGLLFEGTAGKIITQEVKELHQLQFAYWTAMAPVMDLLPHRRTKGWMDPNKTRLAWLGQNRQFRLAQGFFPINHDNVRFEPMQLVGEKPSLLDVADIVVHCAARALSTRHTRGKENYEAVLHQIKPGLSEGHFNVAPGPIMSVKAKPGAIAALREHFQPFLNDRS